mmetsp:Transcript_12466/g.38016  ORF Transcript_12466/g.38016 Transcript_12466/m.38016 type:complete len:87 (+) Transcript_12466:67-327(+)
MPCGNGDNVQNLKIQISAPVGAHTAKKKLGSTFRLCDKLTSQSSAFVLVFAQSFGLKQVTVALGQQAVYKGSTGHIAAKMLPSFPS